MAGQLQRGDFLAVAAGGAQVRCSQITRAMWALLNRACQLLKRHGAAPGTNVCCWDVACCRYLRVFRALDVQPRDTDRRRAAKVVMADRARIDAGRNCAWHRMLDGLELVSVAA